MTVFKSTFLITAICFIIASCAEDTKDLPLKKITSSPSNNIEKKKAVGYDGPHNFYEYYQRIRTRAGDTKPRYSTNYKQIAFQKALKRNQEQGISRNTSLDWQERGPGNVSGRTRGILLDKRDSTYATWLVGSAGGGIWKTVDGGQNYQLKTATIPNLSTTTLAASDANPAIIYAGTGEGFDNQMITGDGIYKSLDGGENWSLLTSTSNNPQFENVLRLVVDPANPAIVLAATRRSFNLTLDSLATNNSYIMKSVDGGITWTDVYNIEGVTKEMFSPTVQQIIADPTDFNKLYASVSNVGILKSFDKGDTWESVFDVGRDSFDRMEIAISSVDPNVLYFATESDFTPRLFTSRDGGNNWIPILGDYRNWFSGQGWYNNGIAAHPYDPNEVFVAGANAFLAINLSADSIDLGVILLGEIINPTKFINLYNPFGEEAILTMRDFAATILDTNLVNQEPLTEVEIRFGTGENQKAHRHILGNDLSNTYLDYVDVPFEVWDIVNERQLMISFVDDDNNGEWSLNEVGIGLPDENSKEIIFIHSVDYNANQPSAELNSFLNKGYYAVFAGTFVGTELETQILPFDTISIKNLIKSNLFATFEPIIDHFGIYGGTSKGVHVDHHQILTIPIDSATGAFYILSTNDGGVAFSKDNGATFLQTGDTFKEGRDITGNPISYPTVTGYNTAQFYGVDKMNGADRYIGGIQDNGSWLSPMNPNDTSIWTAVTGGDGMEAAWNYQNPDLILASAQFNNFHRSADGGETWTTVSLRGNGPFITRIEASKQDPDLVFANNSIGIIKSIDFGLNWSFINMPAEWEFDENLIAISKASPRIVWTGLTFGQTNGLFVSTDEGESFKKTNGYDQAVLGIATGIETHPINKNKGYALFSIADGPKILETNDLGQTWKDISGFEVNQLESKNGFPNVATYSLTVMPFDTNQIWVGTEVGLFESLDGGISWHYADNGLPPVAIYEMKIVNDEVVLATQGRGLWTVSLPELEGYEPQSALISPRVAITSTGFGGQIAGNANLRSSYDSSIVSISIPVADSSEVIERIVVASNEFPESVPFEAFIDASLDTILEAVVTIKSFKDGLILEDQRKILAYNMDEDEAPLTSYATDFDDNLSDFARRRFNILKLNNFDSKALHSPHPYRGSSVDGMMAIFQKPILVQADNSLLTFDEAVLVEIGFSSDVNSPNFLDFVTVEATNDKGKTWINLDRYDSSRHEDWRFAIGINIIGSSQIIKSHQIGLSNFFEDGEVIYLRFRLESNLTFTAWGWMIDNLELKEQTTAIEDLAATVALRSFPNPFTDNIALTYELPNKSVVTADLYSIDGKLISNLIQATQSSGKHRFEVNTSSLAKGIYLCHFQINGVAKTLKWIKE